MDLDFSFLKDCKVMIISDNIVAGLYGDKVMQLLRDVGAEVHLHSIEAGESSKTRENKAVVEDGMLKLSFGRDAVVVALGGGVVSDLAGFVAATYARGSRLVIVPTTLLGMVDASIGGKNGVNTPFGKNAIGTFYEPEKVLIDLSFLNTLSKEEMCNGMAEIIKVGIAYDRQLFDLIGGDIEELIAKSIEIKKGVVLKDPKDRGIRRGLNVGHTIGHALELVENYELSHGKAVAFGILVEGHISYQIGSLPMDDLVKIQEVFDQVGLLIEVKDWDPDKIIAAARRDKKGSKGQPRYSLVESIGKLCEFDGEFCTAVDEKIVKEAILWMLSGSKVQR